MNTQILSGTIKAEITEFKTDTNGGWIGSVKIDGEIHTGEFAWIEDYFAEDGTVCTINWKELM